MFKKIKDIIERQTVIEVTLSKVTFTLIIFIIVFVFIFGNILWNKELSNIKFNYLSFELQKEKEIEQKINDITKIKLNEDERRVVIEKISDLLKPILASNNKDIYGYYDLDLDYNFVGSTVANAINSQIPEKDFFTIKQELFLISGDYLFFKKPLYLNGTETGYIWICCNKFNALYAQFHQLSIIVVTLLILSVIIIILIRNNLSQIRYYLELFTNIIIGNIKEDDNLIKKKLPELLPVLAKIEYFTNNLKETNSELELARSRIDKVIEGITDGFMVLDRKWRCIYINSVAKQLSKSNSDTLLGQRLWSILPELKGTIGESYLFEAASTGQSVFWEAEGSTQPDQYYDYYAYPYSEGITLLIRNITERKRQQKEIDHLERLNLIGQLAAGISHEIRNPLTVVRGFLQLYQKKFPSQEDNCYFDLMIDEIDRSNSIISDFLSLAKIKVDQAKILNINEVINLTFPLLQADAYANNKDVCLNLKQTKDILIDENEIKQLLLNLVRNGLEATNQNGRVTISTLQEAEHVVLVISDDGSGIPIEVQEKIGTPFYTTKDTGTGLGLAISYSIAKRHQALVEFETGTKGTTFFIKFPI